MQFMHGLSEDFFKAESKELIVSEKTKKLWAVLLDMLLSFDEVCKRHGIRYCLDSGSLLGAVRHKGFIPWDNDLDVVMLREEYDKLCSVASEEFKTPLFFQTNYTDPGSARGHAQLRRSDTTGILKSEMLNGSPRFSFNQGVFFDIFALDAVPDRAKELAEFRDLIDADKRRIARIRNALYATGPCAISPLHPGTIREFIARVWYRFKKRYMNRDELDIAYRRMEADVRKYNDCGQRRVANFSLNPRRKDSQLFLRGIYENIADYDFEGYRFPGPADFETVLRGHYGNWHEHVVGGDSHGGVFIDLDKPYTEYLKK